MISKLSIGPKESNGGRDYSGKLHASEFNSLVESVNNAIGGANIAITIAGDDPDNPVVKLDSGGTSAKSRKSAQNNLAVFGFDSPNSLKHTYWWRGPENHPDNNKICDFDDIKQVGCWSWYGERIEVLNRLRNVPKMKMNEDDTIGFRFFVYNMHNVHTFVQEVISEHGHWRRHNTQSKRYIDEWQEVYGELQQKYVWEDNWSDWESLNGGGILIATYEETSYEDVVSAYNNGLEIVVAGGPLNQNTVSTMTYADGQSFKFATIVGNSIQKIGLSNGAGWYEDGVSEFIEVVSTNDIVDGAVSIDKIANNAVTYSKLSDDTKTYLVGLHTGEGDYVGDVFNLKNQNKATGECSHAEGDHTTASGDRSHVGGLYSEASGNASFAHGDHVNATAQNQVAFGAYNETDDDSAFMIGNGTGSGSRSNLFNLKKTGNLIVKYKNQKTNLSKLATESVQFGSSQTLTEEQKATARQNIGAASSTASFNQYKFVEYPGDNSSAMLLDMGITNHRTTILFENAGDEDNPLFTYYYPTAEYTSAGTSCYWVSPNGSTIEYSTEVDHTRYWSKRPTNFVTKTAFNSDKADIWRAIDDTNNDLDSKASFIADLQEQIEGNANNIAGLQTHIGDVEAHSVTHDQLDEVLYGEEGTMEEPTGGVYAVLDYLYNERIEEETREFQRINDRINELDNIFVAEYGVTQYEPVMDALADGKVVVCKYEGTDYSKGYALLTRTNDDKTYMQFAMVVDDNQVRLFSLEDNDRWQTWVENYVSQNDLDDQLNIVLYGEDGTETNPTGGVYGIIGNIQSILAQINGEE